MVNFHFSSSLYETRFPPLVKHNCVPLYHFFYFVLFVLLLCYSVNILETLVFRLKNTDDAEAFKCQDVFLIFRESWLWSQHLCALWKHNYVVNALIEALLHLGDIHERQLIGECFHFTVFQHVKVKRLYVVSSPSCWGFEMTVRAMQACNVWVEKAYSNWTFCLYTVTSNLF